MSATDYEQCLKSCIKQNRNVIDKLNELITETEHHHTVCNSVKTGGTAAGVVGTGLMVGSLLAAPFTGGASLLLTFSAAACSVGGAATNIITGAVDRNKTKKIIAEIQSLIDSRKETASTLQEQATRFSKVIQHLVSSDLSEHTAFYATLTGMAPSISKWNRVCIPLLSTALANGRCSLNAGPVNASDYAPVVAIGRVIQTEFELFKSLESTSKAAGVASKVFSGTNQMILKSAPLAAEE